MIVSVCMITYNQEAFIREAIEGVFMQEVDFDVEFLIADDVSPDGTSDIVQEYVNNQGKGHWIKYIRHTRNKGMMSNFLLALENCKGKYIALCEGDDYWTDPLKLQKQVDFLEKNPDFVICYHKVNVLFPDGKFEEDYWVKGIIGKSESTIYDMAVLGNYIHTPSVVFRNVLKEFPKSFSESPIGDFFLWMLLAQHGKIKKLPDVMAVYRFGVGVHSTQSEKFRQASFLKTLILLSETIEDRTIMEILKNRILAIKSASLPYPVRVLDDLGSLAKAENLRNYVSFGELIKTILLKIQRRF